MLGKMIVGSERQKLNCGFDGSSRAGPGACGWPRAFFVGITNKKNDLLLHMLEMCDKLE
jgi:hypothetical protein